MQRKHPDSEYIARKLQVKLVSDARKSLTLNKEDATRYRSACIRLSSLAQDRWDFADTAKHLAQRMNEHREFDVIPLKRAARYLVRKRRAALRIRGQQHVEKITVFVDSDFGSHPLSSKCTTGLVAPVGSHTVNGGIHTSELDSPERWRSGVLRSGEGK